MKQKVTNQTRRKMLIGGAAAASTPLWLNVAIGPRVLEKQVHAG